MRWALLGMLAGCYNPTVAPGAPCVTSADCPRGQPCMANVCGGTEEIDAPVPVDAAIDAYIPDGVIISQIVLGDDGDELRDTELWGTNPGINYGGQDHFSIDDAESGVLWFDLTQIASTRTVVSAALTVTVSDAADEGGGTVTIHRLREGWVENEATWVARTTMQGWSVTGARPPASDATPVATFSPAAVETPYTVTLPTALVQEWITNPANNYGLVFVRGTSDEHVHIHTRESTKWARLVVMVY